MLKLMIPMIPNHQPCNCGKHPKIRKYLQNFKIRDIPPSFKKNKLLFSTCVTHTHTHTHTHPIGISFKPVLYFRNIDKQVDFLAFVVFFK